MKFVWIGSNYYVNLEHVISIRIGAYTTIVMLDNGAEESISVICHEAINALKHEDMIATPKEEPLSQKEDWPSQYPIFQRIKED